MSLEERLEKEIISNLITYLLLKAVEYNQGETYGYQMKKFVEQFTGRIIPEGTLYPILSKLSDKKKYGYLISTRDESGSRGRRFYRLTDKGLNQLTIWPKKWEKLNLLVESILSEINDRREI